MSLPLITILSHFLNNLHRIGLLQLPTLVMFTQVIQQLYVLFFCIHIVYLI